MARHISISDYTYDLPDDRIARFPLKERDMSKLLIYQNHTIRESRFSQIADILPPKSLLVFNNTKVVHARLLFDVGVAKPVEIFILEPEAGSTIEQAMQKKGDAKWHCLVGNHKQFPEPFLENTFDGGQLLRVYPPVKDGDRFLVHFEWNDDLSFADLLQQLGKVPLPPYLKRNAEASDNERYQTVYARWEGSVAAPTAGLHFTEAILKQLPQHGHTIATVALHVGAGTFRPVKSDTMENHVMHAEEMHVAKATILQLLQHQGPVIAVGTTSLRTLESLFWLGLKLHLRTDRAFAVSDVEQWDAYDLIVPAEFNFSLALQTILEYMEQNALEEIAGRTQLMIAPGYTIRTANGLITNFHQPGSTLLLLVAAFVGDDWRSIYDYALHNQFRFLSYGDSSLLLHNDS